MELEFLKWAVITLLGVATYFLKRTVDQMDEKLKEHKTLHLGLQLDVQNIKNEYLHKSDFRDFKVELRAMFDELKSDIKGLRHNG